MKVGRRGLRPKHRVAVVTGAGSGVGRALARALSQNGAHVAALDIDHTGLAEAKATCRPGHVSAYQVDVADREAVHAYAEQVRRDLGPVSMVFNNAGVDLFASVADMSWSDFDWLIGINIGGVVNGTKALRPSPAPQLKHCWKPSRRTRPQSAKPTGPNAISHSFSPHSWLASAQTRPVGTG